MFTKLDGVSPVLALPDQIAEVLVFFPSWSPPPCCHPHSPSFIRPSPSSSLTRTLHRALDGLAAPPTNVNNTHQSARNTLMGRLYHLSCHFHSHTMLAANCHPENQQSVSLVKSMQQSFSKCSVSLAYLF